MIIGIQGLEVCGQFHPRIASLIEQHVSAGIGESVRSFDGVVGQLHVLGVERVIGHEVLVAAHYEVAGQYNSSILENLEQQQPGLILNVKDSVFVASQVDAHVS